MFRSRKTRAFWDDINRNRALNKLKGGKVARTKEAINQDYGNICAQIGAHTMQIDQLNLQIEEAKQKIMDLGREMQEIMKGEKKDESAPEQQSAAS